MYNTMKFIAISPQTCRSIMPGNDERTVFYRSYHPILRWVFWGRLRRITGFINATGVHGRCLDFGGGTGVLLPSLSTHFHEVCCLDLDAGVARSVVKHLCLSNVSIQEMDVSTPDSRRYEAIVAADVLEHFEDLAMPVDGIVRRITKGGWLFTSLPTENGLYEAIRKLIGKSKPADHYHSACAVEAYLQQRGFRRVMHTSTPIPFLAPLFSISAWRYDGKY